MHIDFDLQEAQDLYFYYLDLDLSPEKYLFVFSKANFGLAQKYFFVSPRKTLS